MDGALAGRRPQMERGGEDTKGWSGQEPCDRCVHAICLVFACDTFTYAVVSEPEKVGPWV